MFRSGVPQRIAQAYLRHKDPRLTAGVYTDESLLPTAATIAQLDWITIPETIEAMTEETKRAALATARAAQNDAQTDTSVQTQDLKVETADDPQPLKATGTCAPGHHRAQSG